MADDRAGLETELRNLLAADRKIEAIKLYCERTGASLAEAKNAVEAMEGGRPEPASDLPADLEQEVAQLLEQGQKLRAVKTYREQTGVGLHEAKEAVEAIGRKRNIASPAGSGCMGVVLLVALGAGLAALL